MATQKTKQTATKAPADQKTGADVFDRAVDLILSRRIEGGYVNDPRDPGGETNFGIAKTHHPGVDIKNLTRDQAIAIYKHEYWQAANCDDLPAPVAIALFDGAVNQGVKTAIRMLQRAVGTNADGIIGPKTCAAILKQDPLDVVLEFMGWRLKRYAHTRNSATYMRGWSIRVLTIYREIFTGDFA